MASTTAFIYFRPVVSLAERRFTTAHISLPLRIVSGPFSSAGITPLSNIDKLKSWLPSQSVPVADKDGKMTPPWYRFLNFFMEVFIGGASSPTLPDIAASVTYSEAQSIAQSVVTVAFAQQALANAQALDAAVAVVRQAALPGAEQIPSVQLTTYDSSGGGGGGGGGD